MMVGLLIFLMVLAGIFLLTWIFTNDFGDE